MDIKPLPSAPVLPTTVDKSTRNAFIEAYGRVNQLIKTAAAAAVSVLPHKATHAVGGSDALSPVDIGAAAASHKSNHATGGSDVLTPSDIGAATAVHTHPGSVVQVVNYETGAVATGTTIIPLDDTIPQNTEGTEFLAVTITPKDSLNTLYIDVTIFLTPSVATWTTCAIFQDVKASALAAFLGWTGTATAPCTVSFRHKMTAGTTSATTLKVRCGPYNSATLTMNGWGGARKLGGVMASSITVTEVAA